MRGSSLTYLSVHFIFSASDALRMEVKMPNAIEAIRNIYLEVEVFVVKTKDKRVVIMVRQTAQANPTTDWFCRVFPEYFNQSGHKTLAVEAEGIICLAADLFGIVPARRLIMRVAADQGRVLGYLTKLLSVRSTFFAHPIDYIGKQGFIIIGIEHIFDSQLWDIAKLIAGQP